VPGRGERTCIDERLGIDAGGGVAGDVANVVGAGALGDEAKGGQILDQIRGRLRLISRICRLARVVIWE
jgi:hypothetical protein